MGFRSAIVPPGSGGLPGTPDGDGPGRPGSGLLANVREAGDIREAIAAALGR